MNLLDKFTGYSVTKSQGYGHRTWPIAVDRLICRFRKKSARYFLEKENNKKTNEHFFEIYTRKLKLILVFQTTV